MLRHRNATVVKAGLWLIMGTAVCSAQESTLPHSPAQSQIAQARAQMKAEPNRFQGYDNLAVGLVHRARETSDADYLKQAAEAVDTGLSMTPDNGELLKARVTVLLGMHKYVEALQLADTLHKRFPDDVLIYGYVADASFALGNYDAAEKAAQWMLNLRRNNIPGLLIAAQLRQVYGDPEGALELLNQAYAETSPIEVEDLAWIANRSAQIEISMGKLDAAQHALDQAARQFPGYQPTAVNQARLRLAQGKYSEAIEAIHAAGVRTPEGLLLVAEALERSGDMDRAGAAWTDFVAIARQDRNVADAANDALILYYADHGKPSEALEAARQQIAITHDADALDAYAWALYANGNYADAAAAINKSLAVGVRDPEVFYHAANIALKSGDSGKARDDFAASLQAGPDSYYASLSLKLLATLPGASGKQSQTTQTVAALSPAARATPESQPAVNVNFPMAKALQTVSPALLLSAATVTDRNIHVAQLEIQRSPADASAYAKLGAAYFQKARETGDVDNYESAEKALTRSLDLVSNDLSAAVPDVTLSEVYMGEHRFKDALAYAERALALGSGDLSPFGIVGDAETDMGDYDAGAASYAKLEVPGARLVPGAAYIRESRTSYLRFIHGKSDEAVVLMQAAVAEGIQAELPRENLAWLYVELGEDYFRAGNISAADGAYYTALTVYPGDYRALAGLAKARAAEGRTAEAIVLYKAAVAVVPMPAFVASLGDLYTKTGDTKEATRCYQLVEYIGMLGKINQVLHNRDLALFYADHDKNLPEALVLAKKEFEVRHDIYTWDALAWAQYKNGNIPEAREAIRKAMEFHTADALLYFHAGMIAKAAGDSESARDSFQQSLKINPQFDVVYADVARQQLGATQIAGGGDEHGR